MYSIADTARMPRPTHRNDCRASSARAPACMQDGSCIHEDSMHTRSELAPRASARRRHLVLGARRTRLGRGCGAGQRGPRERASTGPAHSPRVRVEESEGWVESEGDVDRWRGSVWRTHQQAPARVLEGSLCRLHRTSVWAARDAEFDVVSTRRSTPSVRYVPRSVPVPSPTPESARLRAAKVAVLALRRRG
ncbi:hypothetical protein C8F04DRAFT_1230474 [Mycena alexandri]|uniref:Uncharacterized protein n=1 Tax=Mycena alexandri TaxID=1745969 RepID=A0AAD6TB21_9AGAR|nr:hypothetical protein C8F04DRAFT_1230474 [Mycena alexandri]